MKWIAGERPFKDDHEMLKYGIVICDTLYSWCCEGRGEKHDWKPKAA